MSNERDIALTILRTATAGAGMAARVSTDPIVSGVAVGVGGLLGLVTKIVEEHGLRDAKARFEELLENPATPLTDAELDSDIDALEDELGL